MNNKNHNKRTVISWEITQDCNLDCLFCGVKNLKNEPDWIDKHYLQMEDILTYGAQLRDVINGELMIFFTGGEPFIRDDFLQIAKKFKTDYHMTVACNTNGTLLDQYDYGELCDVFSVMIFSIDGISNTHDYLRNTNGTYKKVVDNIRKLDERRKSKNSDLQIWTNTVLTSKNIGQIRPLLDLFVSLGVDRAQFRPMQYDPRTVLYQELGLHAEHLDTLKNFTIIKEEYSSKIIVDIDEIYLNRIIDYVKNWGNIWGNIIYLKNCRCGLDFFFIDSFDRAYPCCSFFPRTLSNSISLDVAISLLKQQTLSETFNRIRKENVPNSCTRCLDVYAHRVQGKELDELIKKKR